MPPAEMRQPRRPTRAVTHLLVVACFPGRALDRLPVLRRQVEHGARPSVRELVGVAGLDGSSGVSVRVHDALVWVLVVTELDLIETIDAYELD